MRRTGRHHVGESSQPVDDRIRPPVVTTREALSVLPHAPDRYRTRRHRDGTGVVRPRSRNRRGRPRSAPPGERVRNGAWDRCRTCLIGVDCHATETARRDLAGVIERPCSEGPGARSQSGRDSLGPTVRVSRVPSWTEGRQRGPTGQAVGWPDTRRLRPRAGR
jgi:hypothetical protein